MRIILSVAFLGGLALGSPVVAAPFTGNDIYSACTNQTGQVQQGFCYGFIFGSVEAMKWGALVGVVATSPDKIPQSEFDLKSSVALGFCIPPNAENGQILDVVVNYLDENPATRHETARTLIQYALAASFPC
ncbi:hypothetical protein BDE40_1464 [Litoreibacter halocynthiae]|uniref:Rap1a immunity protein domain-containing protein n=1 Tax=Litoreibacter halocynthiae TaxID=1242689 RepID=A0A4R7LGF6_9RHOB|nr:Rap1a/Tai family immunity protein [Litoreibacter halocynthiae]TDT74748.1 hypothetical protein BDE40_1464 [Litoreibacter halocynthiae]